MSPTYFYGTLNNDASSHKIVDIGPRLDGVPGLEVYKLLASCTTFEAALAAGRLFAEKPHPITCDLDEDCSCG